MHAAYTVSLVLLEFGDDGRKETAEGVIENDYDFVRRTEYAERQRQGFLWNEHSDYAVKKTA